MLVNLSAGKEFLMERGLRYGHPLLPLLFNLVAEFLAILVDQFENNKWLHGIHIFGMRERTTFFQYMDDTIFFLRY